MTMDVLTVNAVITLTEIENVSKWKLVALNTQGALAQDAPKTLDLKEDNALLKDAFNQESMQSQALSVKPANQDSLKLAPFAKCQTVFNFSTTAA